MASYDIRPLQLRILDILLALDKVCKEHNLRYYLWAGTMLGAIRHKGFIPWDDDLDIAMPRKDYDLLMANAKEWMPEPFEVVSFETDAKNYPLPFAKIQDGSTTLIERMHLSYLGGIYLDVFPLDGMPSSRLKQRLHFIHYQWLKKALYFVHRDPYRHGHGPSSWIPLLSRKLYTMQGLQEKIRKMQKAYDYDKCDLIVDHDDGLKGVMPKSLLGKPTPVVFEDKTVLGVEHPHEYLTQKYGEYMVIPDGDHQRQHNFDLLDLEKSYKMRSCNIKIFVIHVKNQTEREKNIRRQLEPLHTDYQFVVDGDCEDLTDEIINKYFIMSDKWSTPKGPLPRISCAYKHLLAIRYIIDEGLEGALILEDDIELHNNFLRDFTRSINEWKAEHYNEPLVANYEDSSLKLVPRSKRQKGKMLYRAQRDRFGGCYFVSRKAAESILDYINEHKTSLPNDLFLTQLTKEGVINYYWSHPCLATQGSFTGSLSSTLSNKKDYMIRLRWKFKSSYKQLLYWLR